MSGNDTGGAQWIVCPCNTISDFPQKCPHHDQNWKLKDYGDWFDINYRKNAAKQAWICPRCKVVNAPHVDSCSCTAPTTTITYTPYEPATTYTATGTGQLSWIYCSHANECPMVCPCSKDCICRHEGSCRPDK